ncbi:MAG: hypothetical protein ABJQ71_17620 [Roseibium sp.]
MAKEFGLLASRYVMRAALIAVGAFAGTMVASAQNALVPEPSSTFLNARTAFNNAWDESDLVFMVATFTNGISAGYGDYTPRTTTEFTGSDALSVYAEPIGYGFAETADGYQYKLTASYKLLNTSGQVLAEQGNFAQFTGTGRSKQRELSASLTFQFSGLPAGKYQLETLFVDETSGKQSGFALPFTVSTSN